MELVINLDKALENKIESILKEKIQEIKEFYGNQVQQKEWMNLKEAAKYANVSYNTLISFTNKGLEICEINGVKRISKTEIDRFFRANSY